MHSKLPLSLFCVALLSICFFSQTTEAAQARGLYHNDAHPGKCFISEKIILSPGEKMKAANECVQYACDNAAGMATITTCGVVAPPPNCKLGEYNLKAPTLDECCNRSISCVK